MNKIEKLILESIIIESYKDYINKNDGRQLAKDVAKLHKELKHKIPEKEKRDIGYWMKESPAILWQYLHKLPETKGEIARKQKTNSFNNFINKLKEDKNITFISSSDNIITFAPKNYTGSKEWANQTTDWCVTKSEGYWDDYTTENMIVFIFDFNKTPYNIHNKSGDSYSKLAILYNFDGSVYEVYDAADNKIQNSELKDIISFDMFNNIENFVVKNFKKFSRVTAMDVFELRKNEQKSVNIKYSDAEVIGGGYINVSITIYRYASFLKGDITDKFIQNIENGVLDRYKIEEYFYKSIGKNTYGDFSKINLNIEGFVGLINHTPLKDVYLGVEGNSDKILTINTEEEGNKIMDGVNKLSNDLDIFINNIVEKYS